MTFRCWFKDGSAVLVDADNDSDATRKAESIARNNWGDFPSGSLTEAKEYHRGTTVTKIENLTRRAHESESLTRTKETRR